MLETEIKKLTAAVENLTVAIGTLNLAGSAAPVASENDKAPEPETSKSETTSALPGTETTDSGTGPDLPGTTPTTPDLPGGEPAPQVATPAAVTNRMLPPEHSQMSEIQQHCVTRVAEMSASLGRADIMQGLMSSYGITNLSQTPDEVLQHFLPAAETTFRESMEALKAQSGGK